MVRVLRGELPCGAVTAEPVSTLHLELCSALRRRLTLPPGPPFPSPVRLLLSLLA